MVNLNFKKLHLDAYIHLHASKSHKFGTHDSTGYGGPLQHAYFKIFRQKRISIEIGFYNKLYNAITYFNLKHTYNTMNKTA